MKRYGFGFTVFVLLALLLGQISTGQAAAQAGDPTPGGASRPALGSTRLPTLAGPDELSGDGPWVVRAYYTDRHMVDTLATWREPWEVHHDQGYLVIDVTHDEYARMRAAGFRLEVDQQRTEAYNRPHLPLPEQVAGIPSYSCYRTVEETFATAQSIANQYPDLATWIDIGNSWEKATPGGNAGYDMRVLRLTNANIPGPKPKLFVMSGIHAREYAPAELNTRYAEYLVDHYDTDPDVTWLLDYNEIHLVLHTNPDGRKHAELGEDWRKNTDNDDGCTTSSLWGIDLNRNFQFQWGCCGGSSGDPCDEIYRGPSAASEPETQAIQNYVMAQFPDQRGANLTDPAPLTAMGIFMDLHSYGGDVMWSWGFTPDAPPNGSQLQTLGRKLAYFNGYDPHQSYTMYATDGTTKDFAYGELGLAGYTMEVGTDFFQDCATFENTILPDNMGALLYMAKATRRPYQTPAGPDALDVSVSDDFITPGQPVLLTANVNDTRYGTAGGAEPTQAIAAAAYTIDALPWISASSPVTYAMTAVDGVFNSTTEQVQASIDTSSLSSGRHTLFVRGQDAAGNWGAVSAVFLYVMDPAVSPIFEGVVRDGENNAPLAATIKAGVFETSSDPTTGYYRLQVVSDTYDLTASLAGHVTARWNDRVINNYETIQHNFYLYPTCNVFVDNVESGNQGWMAINGWSISTEASHSPTHAWTDSAGGNYANSANAILMSKVFNLTNYQDVTLSFWHTYDIQSSQDYGYVEYIYGTNTNWTQAASFSGAQSSWTQVNIPLSGLDGKSNVRIRFRLVSDSSGVADGWHVDDVVLTGGGQACVTPVAPAAHFSSNHPISLGAAAVFTNTSLGTPPLTYAWNFGDGEVSAQEKPTHAYTQPGNYTIWLTATNPWGCNSDSATMTVYGLAADFETSTPDRLGEVTHFTNTSSGYPQPVSYLWDFGDGVTSTQVNPTHTYSLPDLYTVQLTASNISATLTATQIVRIHRVITWSGALSTTWHTGGNWLTHLGEQLVPTWVDDAVIPGDGVTAWPQLEADAEAFSLSLLPGSALTIPSGITLSVWSELDNQGVIYRQQNQVVGSAPVTFTLPDSYGMQTAGLVISPTGGALGQLDVTLQENQACGGQGNGAVKMCLRITPEFTHSALITVYHRVDWLNGNSAPIVWHYNSTNRLWEALTTVASDTLSSPWRWTAAEVSNYSIFALADVNNTPTAITLAWAQAGQMAQGRAPLFALGVVGLALGAGYLASRRRRSSL